MISPLVNYLGAEKKAGSQVSPSSRNTLNTYKKGDIFQLRDSKIPFKFSPSKKSLALIFPQTFSRCFFFFFSLLAHTTPKPQGFQFKLGARHSRGAAVAKLQRLMT